MEIPSCDFFVNPPVRSLIVNPKRKERRTSTRLSYF